MVVTLPATVCEKIKQAAKERDETFEGWRRATIIEAVSLVWQHETIERWLEAEASMPMPPDTEMHRRAVEPDSDR